MCDNKTRGYFFILWLKTSSKNIQYNDLLGLNDGEYVHLINQEYHNVKNQVSIIYDAYLSKKD